MTSDYLALERSDVRRSLLSAYLEHIKSRLPKWHRMGTEQMISACVETYKSFPMAELERVDLQKRIIVQNDSLISRVYANVLTSLVQNARNINIISVGSGGSGGIERGLDGQLRKRGKAINRWIGIEPYSSRTEDSFFSPENFITLPITDKSPYVRAARADNTTPVIMANYSLHHMGQDLTRFLERCAGSLAVVLLEEPMADERWADPVSRLERIVYDVLANTAMNPQWADKFLGDHSAFRVQYVTSNDIKENKVKRYSISGVYPETAILVKIFEKTSS